MASFGQSSGAIGPVDIGILAGKGSLFLTRPTLNTYTATREDLLTAAGELFDVVQKGAVKLAINQTYPLRDASQTHRDLQARKTTGSTVFTWESLFSQLTLSGASRDPLIDPASVDLAAPTIVAKITTLWRYLNGESYVP